MSQIDEAVNILRQNSYTDDEIQAILKERGYDWAPQVIKEEPGLASKALDYGLRGLDYAGGLARGGVLGALQNFTQDDLVKLEDVLAGKAPSMGEAIKKIPGLEEDPYYAATALGVGGDIVLDPLTYLSGGVSALNKLGKTGQALNKGIKAVANPLEYAGKGLKSGGKKLYSSAFKNIDTELSKKGVAPISKDLWEQGFIGGNAGLQKFAQKRTDDLMSQRQDLYEIADKLGLRINIPENMSASKEVVSRYASDPQTRDLASKMQATLNKYNEIDLNKLAELEKQYAPQAAKYEAEKLKYLEDVKNYRKAMREYKAQGGDEAQLLLSGASDIGQRPSPNMVEVPLRGPDASMMKAPELVDESMQYSLEPIKQKNVSIKGGLRSTKKDNLPRLARDIAEQEPKYGMQQIPIEGLEFVPNMSTQASLPGMGNMGPGFQTSMLLEPPTKPTRPLAPTMPEAPMKDYSMAEVSDFKSNLYNALGEAGYGDPTKGLTASGKDLQKAMAYDLKNAIINAGNKAGDIGTKVDEINETLSPYLTARKPIEKEIGKQERKNLLTQVKGGLGVFNPTAAGAMYAIEGLNTMPARTVLGKGVYDVGQFTDWSSLVSSPLFRQYLINQQEEQ